MSLYQNGATLRQMADEWDELEAIAEAAEKFMRHITGYRIVGDDGQPTDVLHASIPEAVALEAALKKHRDIWGGSMSTHDDEGEYIPGFNAAWRNFRDTFVRELHLEAILDWLARLLRKFS